MTGRTATVEILLSTYNGSDYLDAQLKSIIEQSHIDWSLLIRDDGSRDDTGDIIALWRERRPEMIRRLDEHSNENLGAVRSFSRLLEHSTAPYVMFADQDDVWLPDKVRLTLEAMRGQERRSGAKRPVLVHTDLTVVDEDLRPLNGSLWKQQGVVQRRNPSLPRIMVENCAWGCTMMLNRPLVTAVGSIPPTAVFHDWWITLVGSAFGDIAPVRRQTLFYRRHGRNESGISDIREVSRSGLADWHVARRRLAELLEESRPRVLAFLDRYRERLAPDQIAAATAFLHLPKRRFLQKRVDILRHRLFFSGLPRTLGLLLLI